MGRALLLACGLLLAGGASCTAPDAATRGETAAPDTVHAATPDTLTMETLETLADTLPPAEAARYAFRGRDLEGKDGPMAKVGYDLAHLYFAHRAYQQEAPDEMFVPPAGARITDDGRVLVDAVAAESGRQLEGDLEALGLRGGAVAGPVVSGRLPIAALPEASQLASLRSMRSSRPATHR